MVFIINTYVFIQVFNLTTLKYKKYNNIIYILELE